MSNIEFIQNYKKQKRQMREVINNNQKKIKLEIIKIYGNNLILICKQTTN